MSMLTQRLQLEPSSADEELRLQVAHRVSVAKRHLSKTRRLMSDINRAIRVTCLLVAESKALLAQPRARSASRKS